MKSFKEFISEALRVANNRLHFDYNSPSDKGSVSTQLGKTSGRKKFIPYTSTSDSGLKVHSVHSGGQGDSYNNVLGAIKGKNDVHVDPEEHKQFINRSANFISNKIIKGNDIDHIVIPKSSSKILHHVAAEVQRRHPHITIHHDALEKDDNGAHVDSDPRLSEKTKKSLSSFVEKGKAAGNIEMKKMAPQYRKFIKVPFRSRVEPKKLEGKHVAILDDIYTSGHSISSMHDTVKAAGAKKVTGITLFKGK